MKNRFNDFDRYMNEVINMLEPNATEEYKSQFVTYCYTTEQVNAHLNYFKAAMRFGMSPYKALLFFHDKIESEQKDNE